MQFYTLITVNLIASENGKQIMPSTQHNFYVTHGDSALHFVGVSHLEKTCGKLCHLIVATCENQRFH